MPAQLIDLGHQISSDMPTYPGLPAPIISDYLTHADSRDRYAGRAAFQIGHVDMVTSTGTYVDAPYHRFPDGADIGSLALSSIAALPGLLVPSRLRGAERAIEVTTLSSFDVAGRAVLFFTRWDRHWGTGQYAQGAPYLTDGAAAWLVDAGAALVGIDALNVDSTDDPSRPVHTRLLAAGIPIVEHLRGLDQLADIPEFRFFAVPAPILGVGSFPARAFALVEPSDGPGVENIDV